MIILAKTLAAVSCPSPMLLTTLGRIGRVYWKLIRSNGLGIELNSIQSRLQLDWIKFFPLLWPKARNLPGELRACEDDFAATLVVVNWQTLAGANQSEAQDEQIKTHTSTPRALILFSIFLRIGVHVVVLIMMRRPWWWRRQFNGTLWLKCLC